MIRAFRAFRLALAFLTILRVPVRNEEISSVSLADARFAYPGIGVLIGLVLAGISELLRRGGVGPAPSAFWLVASTALLTGGLHLDGLADSADGLFLQGDRDRRLAAMRDPHVGSFGVVALILVSLGKFAALENLGDSGRSLAILGAAIVSRSLIVVVSGLAGYARPEGTGRVVIEATTRRDAVVAAIIALVAGGLLASWAGLAASGVAFVVAVGIMRLARRKLGGVTGDILGAVVESGEFSFLMVLAMWSR
jgi:adenosylcobinamide-GDP ribazoletransferase